MNRFKKWLFVKALNFVLRNINEYEDQIFLAIGLDTKLAALIDMVTDLLLNLYLKWRENHSPDFSTENFPKLEKWFKSIADKIDLYDLRYNKGEDAWKKIKGGKPKLK